MTHAARRLTEPLLLSEFTMDRAELCVADGGHVAVITRQAPERTGPNEDSVAIVPDPNGCVIVIADGVGGAPLGAKASSLAIAAMTKTLTTDAEETAVRDRVLDGFEQANAAVMALGVGAATTLVVAQIAGTTLRCYHAGDSAVLVTGQRGRTKLLTMAHSPVGYGIEAGLLDPDDAMTHDQRHVVSNLVGAADMRVEMGSPIELGRRDTVVVGTDGLFDNLGVEEIIALARKGPLLEGADALATLCQIRMAETREGLPSKPDDMTFALFRRA
jgi:serine/threonine protein phosphatase PrpC